jgi:lysine 6-dehydrogenase
MNYDFLIIGSGGMQGKIVSRDLLESGHKVYFADLYKDGSEPLLKKYLDTPFAFVDLRDIESIKNLIKSVNAPVVINCAEGDWNQEVYKVCLEEKRHVIDLGSDIPTTKDHTIEIGFAWDSNVKKFVVPFSIPSIFEELIDPAQVLENGQWIEKIPSTTEVIREFREIGSQKCYLVRHPETYSFSVDYANLKPQNIRFYAGFPDHSLDTLHQLISLGLDDEEPLLIEKQQVKPVDALARMLTRVSKPEEYSERENLWVEVSGKDKHGNIVITRMECIVFTLPGWSDAGCNIDTGLPASIIAQMIKDGRITARGSFAPDHAVPTKEFFKELHKKGMTVYQDGTALNHEAAEDIVSDINVEIPA